MQRVSLTISHRDQCSASLRAMATSEAKIPLLPPPPLLLLLNMMLYGMDHPYDHFGSAVPAVSPPSLLPVSSLLTGGAEREAEKVLMLCELCSATAEILVCCQLPFRHKSRTPHYIGCSKEH